MTFWAGIVLAGMVFAQNLTPPPWVRPGSVVNLANRLPSSLPGGALAPGALISIEGLRFDPAGAAVEIEFQGKVYAAAVVHASSDRITARMPDFARGGTARLFVLSGGKRSVGSEVRLAPSAFGIFTDREILVAPDGRVTLFGTGLGHVSESAIEVFVAGRRAGRVRRSVDQLSFDLPAGTAPGCALPVVVVAGGLTSNTALLKIGDASGCVAASRRPTGNVVLMRSDVVLELTPGKPVAFQLDNFAAVFERRRDGSVPDPLDLIPPAGACLAWAGEFRASEFVLPSLIRVSPDSADATVDLGPDVEERTSSIDDLDAGPEVTIAGPLGERKVKRSVRKPRVYTLMLGGNPPVTRIPPTPLFLSPGMYRVEIPGGEDVGPASIDVAMPEAVAWRNREATRVLDRKAGAELEFSMPEGYRALVFAWNIDRRDSSAGAAICSAVGGASKFRMPGLALANFPATRSGESDLSLGFLGVAAIPVEPGTIPARGLERSRVVGGSLSGRSVVVK